jgi:uncharacterized repeat protein (TIGR03803 family)
MLKILQTATTARWLGILLLAFAIVVPGKAATPTLTTLYNFTDLGDGGFPEAGLVSGGAGGSLFGTASSGGGLGWGSVFKLTPSDGTWTLTTIWDFTGGADGGDPLSDLLMGSNGVMYGTTYLGGAHGYGTVYQVAPKTGGGWTQKVLYSFAGGDDGAYPTGGLAILSKNGVLYGTTYGGGSAGVGTLFELIPSAGGWSEKVLYTFQGGADGANPMADLTLASSGSLYGTTSQGGLVTIPAGTSPCPSNPQNTPCVYQNWGTVFELTPEGGGVWTESLLYTFLGGSDGGSPESPVILGANGVLYGSTFWGGTPTACAIGEYPQGCGTIYQVAPPTGSETTWTETVLHTFTGVSPDGAFPYGKLGLNTAGVLFGTTYSGGANVETCSEAYSGCGTIFTVTPPSKPGGAWKKSNLTVFPGSPGGGSPNGLIIGTGGTMYGTTILGGATGGYGTVFQMTP